MGGQNRSIEAGATGPEPNPDPSPGRTRLLVVTSLYPTPDQPATGPFVRRRVDALRARGVTVDVMAARDYRAGAIRRHASMLARGLRHQPRPDGVEGHVLFPAGLIALWVARFHGRPLVMYAHGSDLAVSAQRSPLHRALARLVAKSADAVVTNSSANAARVARLGRTAIVISPGVDFERFRPGDRRAARRELGLPLDAHVALSFGARSPQKGADTFAEALQLASEWLGVLVGSVEPALGSAAPSGRVRVQATLQPDAVPMWMVAADVVVVPSRDEALGLAAVEALACGTPVVATSVGGLPEVVRHGVNGLIVPPSDPVAIAGALDRLADPRFRATLAAAARDSVLDHEIGRTTAKMADVWAALGVRT